MLRRIVTPLTALCLGVAGAVAYMMAVDWMQQRRPPLSDLAQPEVVLPGPLNVVLASGDAYLAANANFFRALVASSERLDPAVVRNLGELQRQTAILNPANEDNYYVATATLPWWGAVETANDILSRAADARPRDPYPLFFLGFNRQYFSGDYEGAGRVVERAAQRVDGGMRTALLAIAAKWYARGQTPQVALGVLRDMAARSADKALRQFIELRVHRLEGLLVLRDAVSRYRARYGREPNGFEDLTRDGILDSLPVDPLGLGFELKPDGQVLMRFPQPGKPVS